MPFRDAEARRRYDRERKRRIRSADGRLPPLDAPVRLRVAEDVEALLAEAVERARADPKAKGVEKGRALGYLASIALRLIEAHDLADRLEAVEDMLRLRSVQ
jgi:hypothetical protein